jgi:putative MATE family efflux protein
MAEIEAPQDAAGVPEGPAPGVHGGRDLTVGSIPRHLLTFSAPMLLGALLQNAYAVINGMWVGKGLSEADLAAVTATFPIFWMFVSAAIGLTMASNILVSQAYGAKDWGQLRRVVGNSVVFVGAACVALFLAGQVFAGALLRLLNTPPDIYAHAASYFHIYLWTLPTSFGIFLLAAFLRGSGDSVTPLWFQGGAVILACILDPVLMFGWLGAPRLGLNGTAYASIFAQLLPVIALWAHLRRKRHIVLPRIADLRFDTQTTLLTLRIGIPSMIQQSLLAIGSMVLTGLVNRFGVDTTAAYGAASRIEMVAIMPAMTVGLAASSLSGQNIGARQFARVREVFGWSLLTGAGVTLGVSLAAVCIPRVLLSAFLDKPEALDIGVGYLRIVGSGYLFMAVLFACNGVINGAGHTLATTLATLISLWICRVPLALYLSRRMDSVEGVWWAIVISFVVGMVVSLTYFLSGRWKHPLTLHLNPVPVPPAGDSVPPNEPPVPGSEGSEP